MGFCLFVGFCWVVDVLFCGFLFGFGFVCFGVLFFGLVFVGLLVGFIGLGLVVDFWGFGLFGVFLRTNLLFVTRL